MHVYVIMVVMVAGWLVVGCACVIGVVVVGGWW